MKKTRFIALLLLLSLLCAMLAPGALATNNAPTADAQNSETAASDAAKTGSDGAASVQGDSAASGAASTAYTVKAKAAMLIELNTNQTLLEQNADTKIYPASLTKIMTCLLALEHGKLTDVVTVSETALQGLSEAGSTAGLVAGEQLTLEELLYCMMLSSANEACNVVAEYISGSVAAFVDLMNQEAAALGCKGTHFANPHGLHDENHYTTARDLSIIAQAALKNETFVTITSTTSHEVPATNLSGPRDLVTTNYLVSRDTTSNYYYEYAKGVKTGYTSQAGRCLISTADNGKLKLLSVVCGAETVVLDSGDLELENFTETKALFEYGFQNFAYAKVLTTLYPLTQIPVLMSAGAGEALLAPSSEVTALLPADFDESQIQQDIRLNNPDGVEAPIAKGQVLGTITVSYQGKALGTSDLVAITDIPRSQIASQAASTKSFFAANWWKLLIGLLVLLIALYFAAVSVGRARRRRRRQQLREQARRRRGGDVIEFPGRGSGGDEE